MPAKRPTIPRAVWQGSGIAFTDDVSDIPVSAPSELPIALVYLVSNLSDPLKPTACAGTLVYALARFDGLVSCSEFTNQKDFGNLDIDRLWSTLYTFLTHNRTEDQFLKMLTTFSQCSCKRSNGISLKFHMEYLSASLHRQPRSKVGVWSFIERSTALLHARLVYAKRPALIKGIHKKWPFRIPDLIPSGPEPLVRSFLLWQRHLDKPVPPNLFLDLIKHCATLGHDGASVVHSSVANLNAINILLLGPMKSNIDKMLSALEGEQSQTETLEKNFRALQKSALDLTECIYEMSISPIKTCVKMFCNGAETKALQLCSMVFYLLPMIEQRLGIHHDPSISQYKMQCPIFCGWIFHAYRMYLTQCPDIPLHPDLVNDANQHYTFLIAFPHRYLDDPEFIATVIARQIVLCRFLKPCFGPGCQQAFSTKGEDFKTCRGCQAVGYCSRDCEIGHWKSEAEGGGHRNTCGILKKILGQYGRWKLSADALDRIMDEVPQLGKVIHWMYKEGRLSTAEFQSMTLWAKHALIHSESQAPAEIIPKWKPGYKDYNEIISRLVKLGNGPAPGVMDRQVHGLAVTQATGRVKIEWQTCIEALTQAPVRNPLNASTNMYFFANITAIFVTLTALLVKQTSAQCNPTGPGVCTLTFFGTSTSSSSSMNWNTLAVYNSACTLLYTQSNPTQGMVFSAGLSSTISVTRLRQDSTWTDVRFNYNSSPVASYTTPWCKIQAPVPNGYTCQKAFNC
ncbi:hypothetical protein CVT24_001773 [Panaeolus cyanescens]|uniref:MYND-type domain-containing protein n=1 Tax=Panaeolus cyanescens TaxID=181874 RepID=A0A409YUB2_9AGAR|nr:hypothetical protein CVT24_001773 [Panaeolus cyanescens]